MFLSWFKSGPAIVLHTDNLKRWVANLKNCTICSTSASLSERSLQTRFGPGEPKTTVFKPDFLTPSAIESK